MNVDVGRASMSTKTNDRAGAGMTESPFNELAAELRSRIWEITVVNEQPLEVVFTSEPDDEITFSLIDKSTTSLLMTCKQVREECASMFYSRNTFRLRSGNPPSTNDLVWETMSNPVVHKFRFINTISTRLMVTRIIFVAPTSSGRDYGDFNAFDLVVLAFVCNSMQAAYDGHLRELLAEVYIKLPKGPEPQSPRKMMRVTADVPSFSMHPEIGKIVSDMFEDGDEIDENFASKMGMLGFEYEVL